MPQDSAPKGHTIFCDDIRAERSGQFTLVGVYTSGIVVHSSFPATVPKFGLSINLMEPRALAAVRDFPVTLQIYLPGDSEPPYKAEIQPPSQEILKAMFDQYQEIPQIDGEEPDPHVTSLLNLTITSMVLRGPGVIRVRLRYGGQNIKCGGLSVTASPRQTSTVGQAS